MKTVVVHTLSITYMIFLAFENTLNAELCFEKADEEQSTTSPIVLALTGSIKAAGADTAMQSTAIRALGATCRWSSGKGVRFFAVVVFQFH